MKKSKNVVPLVEPGNVLRQFSQQEVAGLVERWLKVFGKNRQGVHASQYMWHVFSYERYPSVSGAEAERLYEQQAAAEYIVLSNERDEGFVTDARPQHCTLRDYYVFPENLAWTMAFTHEDGWLGPYFARHPRFDELNAENAARIKKARDIEMARSKGWL